MTEKDSDYAGAKQLAISFAIAQLAATVAAGLFLWAAVGTVLFVWPVLAVIGFANCRVTWPFRSRLVFAFGVSAPLVTALGAGLLVGLDWVQRPSRYTQHDVVELLGGLLLLYGVVLLPLFVGTLCHVLGWRGGALAPPKTRWQFSLRTLLVLMTVVAIGVALLGGAARVVNDKIALWVFGGYAVVVFAACGVTIERFQAARQEE